MKVVRAIQKLPTMNKQKIQSEINAVNARILQYQNSDLHSDAEKSVLIKKEEKELERLQLKLADEIIVSDAEIL